MPPLHRSPRGTRDLLPESQPFWDHVEEIAHDISLNYGFSQINTPTFEDTSLFIRGIGKGTDLVDKEMYTFQDKGGNSQTLRSEGTAPVMRAYLQHGMHTLNQPVKLYYIAPVFRYDRPQAGRYREHRQFGVEAIGETDPALDAEVITLAHDYYKKLGISKISLQLNSIGCNTCRPLYLKKLVGFYQKHRSNLGQDCRNRLDINPLRLFDCKEKNCRNSLLDPLPLISEAPKVIDSLCGECESHFKHLQDYLEASKLSFTLNPTLVRGLDYYTKTVFEFWAQGIGAQNAVGGGGRYDGLAELLGGKRAPGIGFGIGLDRAIISLQEQNIKVPEKTQPEAFLVSLGNLARRKTLILLRSLRQAGIRVESTFGNRSMRSQMRQANASGAFYTIILGEDELAKEQVTSRDMASGEQKQIPLETIVVQLKKDLESWE